jgi:hypothetical protein
MSDTRDSRLLAVLNKLLDTSTTTVKRDLERHRSELTRNEFDDEEEEEEDETMDNDGSQNAQAEVIQSQLAVNAVPQSNEGSQGKRSGKKRKL